MVLIPAGPFAMGNCMKPLKPSFVSRAKAFMRGESRFRRSGYDTSLAARWRAFVSIRPADESPDELPVHTVMVSAFYMDKHEVTKEKWDEVYTWATNNGYVFNPGNGKAPDHPVHSVSWYDCVKRLPPANRGGMGEGGAGWHCRTAVSMGRYHLA